MPYTELLESKVSDNTILIIGAGLSGAFAALEAARRGRRVFLIDQGNQVIPDSSSSYNECYKLHTGLHYAGNVKTAVKCLEDSIAFAKSIPAECLAGQLNEPWRRGRHFVMSNSLFPAEHVKQVALLLQKRYAELVAQDPKNKVFGEPKEFIKFLSEADYPYVAKNISFSDSTKLKRQNIKVVLGIETGESQIDIKKLREHLKQEIKSNSKITFIPRMRVINLAHLPNQLGYAVTVAGPTGRQVWHVPDIMNCAWQNIESLSKQLGFYTPDENRVIRVKVCTLVKLPKSLEKVNTCIFSIGPFVSITNLGNGEAVLASETTTNVGHYKAGTDNLSPELAEIIKKPLNIHTGKGASLSEKILRECASYLPDLAQAKVLEVMLGYVKMVNIPTPYNGLSSLFEQHSPIHQRLERGVEVESGALGYVANSGNKMTYTVRNAQEACNILDHHSRLRVTIGQFLLQIKPLVISTLKKLGKGYERHLTDPLLFAVCKRAFLSNSSMPYQEVVLRDILATVKRKETVLALIRHGSVKKLTHVEAPVPKKAVSDSKAETSHLRSKL